MDERYNDHDRHRDDVNQKFSRGNCGACRACSHECDQPETGHDREQSERGAQERRHENHGGDHGRLMNELARPELPAPQLAPGRQR